MSNDHDENLRRHADSYHKELKRLMNENQDTVNKLDAYNNDIGNKPSREDFHAINGPIYSPEEMSRLAKDVADRKMQEQAVLERAGLIEPEKDQQQGAKRNSLEAFFGNDKEGLEKARGEQEKKIQMDRDRENQQDRGKGHDLKP